MVGAGLVLRPLRQAQQSIDAPVGTGGACCGGWLFPWQEKWFKNGHTPGLREPPAKCRGASCILPNEIV